MPKEPEYEMPLIHMNGDKAATLITQYDNAAETFDAFLDSWENVELNARNYYPKGPDSYPKARDQRTEINAKIAEIKNYILEHRIYLHSL
jgi:hypothetical protein